MALLRCDFVSEVLKMDTSMTVILPQDLSTPFSPEPAPIRTAPPVLYLLHGLGDDATAWTRQTAIERYVGPLGVAIVMPQVGRSFYADQVHGQPYWTFLTEELPALVDSMFHVSTRREDTFVAGLSMGGFGAMRWASRAPERFAAAVASRARWTRRRSAASANRIARRSWRRPSARGHRRHRGRCAASAGEAAVGRPTLPAHLPLLR